MVKYIYLGVVLGERNSTPSTELCTGVGFTKKKKKRKKENGATLLESYYDVSDTLPFFISSLSTYSSQF